MTRRQKAPYKKKGGGLLTGMRRGVKSVAGTVTGATVEKAPGRKGWNIFWNVVTGILVLVAAAMFLRRCGVIQF
jgi:hypothetical protein